MFLRFFPIGFTLKPDNSLFLLTFIYVIYLFSFFFFWLRQVLVAAHGISFVPAQGLLWFLSSCSAWASLSLWHAVSRAHGLCSLQHAGSLVEARSSVVAACGLSCPAAPEILVPRPGIEPTSPALEGRFFTTGPPWESPLTFFSF